MLERNQKDYPGEYVISNVTIRNGKKEFIREWIPNPIQLAKLGERATCIALDEKLKDTTYSTVQNNSGGHLGENRMTVYGVEGVWRKMVPNFLICRVASELKSMIEENYPEKSIVYTTASLCIKYPGEFYLTPHDIALEPHALALWLACFNGHKEIYLLGYSDIENEKMVAQVAKVIKDFKAVEFIQVTRYRSPEQWLDQDNFSTTTLNEYASHCDV